MTKKIKKNEDATGDRHREMLPDMFSILNDLQN